MISTIFEILATIVVCSTGSAGGYLFAFGLQDKSYRVAVGGVALAAAGMVVGMLFGGVGDLVAKGCGL